MRYSSILGLATALCGGATFAAPIDAVQMGSKHNLYLSTCTRRSTAPPIPSCPLIILCPKAEPAAVDIYTAVAYYANGQSNGNPTEIATVSDPAQSWEGTLRVANLRTSAFSSNINADAAGLEKSAMAGQAKLGTEDFVCFKDGETAFTARDGLQQASCTANYWCASLSV